MSARAGQGRVSIGRQLAHAPVTDKQRLEQRLHEPREQRDALSMTQSHEGIDACVANRRTRNAYWYCVETYGYALPLTRIRTTHV